MSLFLLGLGSWNNSC